MNGLVGNECTYDSKNNNIKHLTLNQKFIMIMC